MASSAPPLSEKPTSSGPIIRFLGWFAGGKGRPAALVVAVGMVIIFGFWGDTLWFGIQTRVFDTYQVLFPRKVERFPVVIVDIDDESLARLGRWPWPRNRLAALIRTVHELGALAIGLDIVMPEADSYSPQTLLEGRETASATLRDELANLPSNDDILIRALRETPTVVARAGLIDSRQGNAKRQIPQTAVMVAGNDPIPFIQTYDDQITNIPAIEKAASGAGYLNDTRDKDGVVRTMPLLISVNGVLGPSLGIELLRTAVGARWYQVHSGKSGVTGIQIGDTFLPSDPNGRLRLHFSPAYQARRVSALAILNDEVPIRALANQIAIIGVTGVGALDVVATPVAARMDGVEIQAQVIENLLDGSRLIRNAVLSWVELGVFATGALLLIICLPFMRPVYGALTFTGFALVAASAALVSFQHWRLLLDPSFPVIGNAGILVLMMTAGYARAERKRRELDLALEAERVERIRMSGELKAARVIQMGMLPDPRAIEGLPAHLDIYAVLKPAQEVGGDLYDAFMINARHFFFIVGDVSGKGIPASLFMALTKTLIRSLAARQPDSLGQLMTMANLEMARENPAMLFVTAFAGIIDTQNGNVQVCGAGHDAPILLRHGQLPMSLEIGNGPPLCALDDFEYQEERFKMVPGDMLVLITDGITEAHDAAGSLFGRERTLTALARSERHKDSESICKHLLGDVERFADGTAPHDDITILGVRFLGVPG